MTAKGSARLGTDPMAQRRRLRQELKRLRTEAGMTQREVAQALDWSPSKVIRIENGSVAVATTDLRALLMLFEMKDKRHEQELVEMARASKKQPWAQFRDVYSHEAIQYFAYEASASIIREYSNSWVPGLLQTEEYATALLSGVWSPEEKVVSRKVEFRMERQEELLDREQPPEMFFIMDEAVLRQGVGGPRTMRRQLERLAELAKRPEITIQILPFGSGAHFGMRGPFIYLEFPSEGDDDVLFLENQLGDQVSRDDTEITTQFLQAFWDMEEKASPTGALGAYLDKALASLSEGNETSETTT
ncbi:MAG: helix-turn-helix domain-containing protein [Actinomycetales bacterium]|nr:helix-turn-helix domain-containing protein [Actinomycetales bacterium]